jgi:hypothetical protein
VTTPYIYASNAKGSGTSSHFEDWLLGSANHVVLGHAKIWLMISPSPENVKKYERLCDDLKQRPTDERKCSQFVRDRALLLSTATLDESRTVPTTWSGGVISLGRQSLSMYGRSSLESGVSERKTRAVTPRTNLAAS